MVESNYSESYLRTNLVKQIIGETTYYYSLGKKDQKSFSIMSNERLLILNFSKGHIFYNNQTRGLPFRDK